MRKTKTLFSAITLILISAGMGHVYAAEAEEEKPIEVWQYVLAGASFILAGVFYSSSGWIKKVRRKVVGSGEKLDYHKMGRSVLVGLILGVGAIIYSAYQGETIIITTVEQFLVQVGLNTTAILLVDKWVLGRAEPDEKAGPTGDTDEDDFDGPDIADRPPEVPPGKEV